MHSLECAQDDIVHEDLTVRENLNYSARMRLATDMDTQRRKHVVRDALEMLGLTAIQHYRVRAPVWPAGNRAGAAWWLWCIMS